jgi:hypothetical protein
LKADSGLLSLVDDLLVAESHKIASLTRHRQKTAFPRFSDI